MDLQSASMVFRTDAMANPENHHTYIRGIGILDAAGSGCAFEGQIDNRYQTTVSDEIKSELL